ncbi:MAG: AI-2E family transporter [Actinomycetota bacterium]
MSDDAVASPAGIDLDPRSALPIATAVALLATSVWFVRSVPRTVSAVAVGALIALALNPLVEALERRLSWRRRRAAASVLGGFAVVFALGLTLVALPTIRQVQDIDDDIPEVVDDLQSLPIVGDELEDDAAQDVEDWLDELPERLSVDAKPVERAVGTVADGIAAGFLTLLLAMALLLDGDHLVNLTRTLVPIRRRADADRIGRLVYDVVGRYIAGSLLVAALAGTVMLSASLVLGLPLAPLVGVWVAMTNMIPQIGGFLGAVPFVLLGTTQGAGTGLACVAIFLVYQNIENHVLQPLIVGRAVKLSPPATMVAALIGVSAGGVVGALFAVPILGASKAVYLAFRERRP